ncbi:hypothetical protein DPMN_188754 [Dreissena polymorpha]|uniref:Uncharacterized protein n=1 Tax=Dreissena polymorpha TaxID=45954 RepID=A0A9D4DRB9_DREPO|nr:hypothetical protein DPMN_188754 [Dreissena polymorpha]
MITDAHYLATLFEGFLIICLPNMITDAHYLATLFEGFLIICLPNMITDAHIDLFCTIRLRLKHPTIFFRHSLTATRTSSGAHFLAVVGQCGFQR